MEKTKFYKQISILVIFLILIILSVSFFAIKETKAGAEHNVWGWAWSENIGWISFNNISGGGATNYGVNIDSSTDLFSGYAWSENIGWISFEPADVAGCPIGTCQAELDLNTGAVSGWARALAFGGGWDGWIKLRGWTNEAVPQEYGVSLNSAPFPSEFEGWAWGDVVVGWISFNCSNTGVCGVSDYKVMTNVVLNNPPSAIGLDSIEGNYCGCAIGQVTQCSGSKSSPPIYLNWAFDDPGDSQYAYQIQIDNSGAGFPSPEVDTGKVLTAGPGPDYSYAPMGLSFNTPQYWWRLKVWDSGDLVSDDWIYPAISFFATDIRWPNTKFTPDLLNPPAEVEVTFTDESKCYTPAGAEYDCKDGGAGVSYSWNFGDDSPVDITKGDVSHSYVISGDYIVRLEVTGSMCPCVFPLTATLPLPTWKEIVPF